MSEGRKKSSPAVERRAGAKAAEGIRRAGKNRATRRDASKFSTLDSLLAEDGTLEAFQAKAIEEVIARPVEQALENANLSQPPRLRQQDKS